MWTISETSLTNTNEKNTTNADQQLNEIIQDKPNGTTLQVEITSTSHHATI